MNKKYYKVHFNGKVYIRRGICIGREYANDIFYLRLKELRKNKKGLKIIGDNLTKKQIEQLWKDANN